MAEQRPAVSHETFYATVLTESGKVQPVGKGQDGARRVSFANGMEAVLKPKLFGTQDNHGIAPQTQYRREAAAYQYDRQLLGWNVVPPATLTVYQGRPASIAAWMAGVPARALAPTLFDRDCPDRKGQVALLAAKVDTDALRRVVLFDLLVNNTDRHGKNVVFDTFSHRVWAIDNGNTFGRYLEGYYQVFHRLMWPKHLHLQDEERTLLQSITYDRMSQALGRYLPLPDIKMAYLRVRWVLDQENLGFSVLSSQQDRLPSWRLWFVQHLTEAQPSEVTRRLQRWGQTA